MGITAGDHDVLAAGAVPQRLHHIIDVDPTPLHRISELIQDIQAVTFGGQITLDLLPALGRVTRVVLLGARALDPGPALAHLVPGHGGTLAGLRMVLAERGEGVLLPHPPLGTLHELEDADRPAGVPGPQCEPERGRGLALPGAGVDGQDRPAAALAGGEAVV